MDSPHCACRRTDWLRTAGRRSPFLHLSPLLPAALRCFNDFTVAVAPDKPHASGLQFHRIYALEPNFASTSTLS